MLARRAASTLSVRRQTIHLPLAAPGWADRLLHRFATAFFLLPESRIPGFRQTEHCDIRNF